MSGRHQKTIYVDLDGTLAHYERWDGGHIGEPINEMVKRVKDAHNAGHEIIIFTARLSAVTRAQLRGLTRPGTIASERDRIKDSIATWCATHLGFTPEITCIKGMDATEFWDDRAVRIGKNTGEAGDLDGTIWASLGGNTRTE
jgi:hypothetical protein